jgi:6-pyruvoyltetrahydropterin/6-carboxytetrahydropterin synthase
MARELAGSRVRLTRRAVFSASHRLYRPDWDASRNREVFGRASSPHSHGHNYELEVTLVGPVDAETGMLVDLKWLKEVIEQEVEARFDHRDLNDDTPFFRTTPPTAEQLASVIFGLLAKALPAGLLSSVKLRPTRDFEVEVTA